MNKWILSLFRKERPWVNSSCCSLQRSDCEKIALDFYKKEQCQWFTCDLSELLSKRAICLKKTYFLFVFDSFPPFHAKRVNRSWRSLLSRSSLKIDRINSLSSLFTKEQPWGIAPIDHYKRATVSKLIVSIFKKEQQEQFTLIHEPISLSLFWSQKTKNRWSNSQSWFLCVFKNTEQKNICASIVLKAKT